MTITTREGTNGFERNQADTTLSWDDGTRTLTISPTGTFFKIFVAGRPYVITTPRQVVIPNTTGQYIIFFDDSGTLQTELSNDLTPAIVRRDALVSVVYWNATQGTAVLVADERHGLMDADSHIHFHNTIGSQIQRDASVGIFRMLGIQGFGNGDNANAMWVAIEPGVLRDEDVVSEPGTSLTQFGTPAATNPFDNPPLTPTTMPTIWRAGVDGDWYIQAANDYPALNLSGAVTGYAGGLHPWNEDTGSGWQLTELASGNYYLMHVYAWNDTRYRLVGVVGQAFYTDITGVRNAAVNEIQRLAFDGLPFPELKPLYSILCQTNTGYNNEPRSRFIETAGGEPSYVDWRGQLIPTVVSPIA